MEDLTEYWIREAGPTDKKDVLNIRENVYGGRDYLPEYYDDFMKSPHITAFVLCHNGKIIGFTAAYIVDGGETLVARAGRISPSYEGKELYGYLDSYVSQWAKTKGACRKAFTASALNKNLDKASFRAQNQLILSKSHLIYILQTENLYFKDGDCQLMEELPVLSEENLKSYIQSDAAKPVLFPGGRISINSVPYKVLNCNIPLIMSDTHLTAFSNFEQHDGFCKGLLSFGTLYRVQRFSYQYTIDVYGGDSNSVRLHLLRHVLEIKRRVTGSVCVLLPFQTELSPDHVDKIFLEFGCRRENIADSEESVSWITCDFLFEKSLI